MDVLQFDETTLINFLLSDKEKDPLQINEETLEFQRYHVDDTTLYYKCVYNNVVFYWCNLNNYASVPMFEIRADGDAYIKFEAILGNFFPVDMIKEHEDDL